jgi:putative SOS response-associated peptidase YedK
VEGSGRRDPATFAIITTDANAEMVALHDRMPVILEPGDWPLWLGETEGDPATLPHPALDHTLRIWPVSRAVNTPRNNGPELLKPVS